MTDLVSRLLPCAHCGGQPLRDSMVMEPTTVLLYEIMCEDCAMQTGGHTTSEAAAEAWNRRVPDQQAADRIKALEGALNAARYCLNTQDEPSFPSTIKMIDAALSGAVAPPDGLVEALRLLQEWRDTPGNWRNAAWWNQWTARVDAITAHRSVT